MKWVVEEGMKEGSKEEQKEGRTKGDMEKGRNICERERERQRQRERERECSSYFFFFSTFHMFSAVYTFEDRNKKMEK